MRNRKILKFTEGKKVLVSEPCTDFTRTPQKKTKTHVRTEVRKAESNRKVVK